MTKLLMTRDLSGAPIYQLQFPAIKYSATLAANTEATLTVTGSSTSWVVVFRYEPGANIYFALNATAAVPVGGTFASTTSCLNFPGTTVKTGDVLHFITADTTADVGIELYEF